MFTLIDNKMPEKNKYFAITKILSISNDEDKGPRLDEIRTVMSNLGALAIWSNPDIESEIINGLFLGSSDRLKLATGQLNEIQLEELVEIQNRLELELQEAFQKADDENRLTQEESLVISSEVHKDNLSRVIELLKQVDPELDISYINATTRGSIIKAIDIEAKRLKALQTKTID
ncbi:MAG: hypothetical protein Q9M91_01900 [Candidatus Dojkabacteria bacterium]|nr:hypothetical protein [Candidatus Dojkabacteria bacterium]MDQ7020577.1 hypothetical protein [Candidatus Dojkabacteria bacterium]